MGFKLGKLAPKAHPNTLLFGSFWHSGLEPVAPPPVKRAWEYDPKILAAGWGMYANDSCSCCTCAAKAHVIMAATANVGNLVVPEPAEIMALYQSLSGYNPATGQNDTGLAMTDVFDHWFKNPIAGQKLLGWVKIDVKNRTHFEQCINLFGTCDVGVQFPQSAEDQFANNQPWDIVGRDGGILGGHDVPYLGYGSEGETCITWGRRQQCGIPWFQTYADEGYGLIMEGWFDTAGKTPSGFDSDALWKALQALKA